MILRANLGQALAVVGIAHVAAGLFFDRARGVTSRRLSKRDEDDEEDDDKVLQIPLRNFGNQQYTVHIQMAKPAVWFNFTLANTHGYTAVAGLGCESCCTDPHEGLYNPAASSTYVSPLQGAQNITFNLNGKTCTGQKAAENCAFKEQTDNGTKWWEYDDQHIIVASTGSSSGLFGTSAGLAGLGYSSVANGSDSIIGKYLSLEPDEDFTFAISLFGVGSTTAPNGAQLAGDSSGGYMHLNGADSSFYSGSIETLPVAGSDTTVNFGSAPDQVGSYDWTVRMQGWLLKTDNSQGETTVTGGQGMYATMEAGYPYILLPQADASKIYSAITGAQTYILPSGATADNGVAVYDDTLALSWAVPCTTTNVAMYMNFNGTSIPIQPSDLWTSIGGVCVGNIKGWADPTRTTAIMGSTFFRNAYVVFTASSDSTQNTVGIAARPSAAKTHNNTKIIVGAVVGGVGFVALCIFGFLFFLRWKKARRGLAPSAAFATSNGGIDQTTMGSRTMTALSLDREKSPGPTGSSFFGSMMSHGKGSYGVDGQNYVAEPWVPPPSTASHGAQGGQGVMVQPWTPTEVSEQAFLSPTGTAAELPYQQTPSPRPNTTSPRPMSGYGAPTGSVGHQRPMSQVSWVSGTTQMAPQSAVSGGFVVPSPSAQMPMQPSNGQGQMQPPTNSIMQVHPPGAHVPTVRPLPQRPEAGDRTSGVM